MLFDIAGLVREPERVVPLIERIIDSHAQAFVADRSGEIAEEIAFGTRFNGIPRTAPGGGGFFAWPQSEAFVMLRGESYVFSTRPREDVGPMIWVEKFGAKLRGEVFVWKVCAVLFLMIGPSAGLDGAGFRIVLCRW